MNTFKDLNFKLCILEELMYNLELIKPKFDIYEFAEEHGIDTEEVGYEPIPKALQYFQNLEISQALLDKVTEIYQDGGNEIYMNIAPLWDGEDDAFLVESFEDIKLLPNLKKMTVFQFDEEDKKLFDARGIEVELL